MVPMHQHYAPFLLVLKFGQPGRKYRSVAPMQRIQVIHLFREFPVGYWWREQGEGEVDCDIHRQAARERQYSDSKSYVCKALRQPVTCCIDGAPRGSC
jgi:hypothetical protein